MSFNTFFVAHGATHLFLHICCCKTYATLSMSYRYMHSKSCLGKGSQSLAAMYALAWQCKESRALTTKTIRSMHIAAKGKLASSLALSATACAVLAALSSKPGNSV